MLLVEYNVLDKVKVINEGTKASPRVRLQGKFQKCDEQNNNGRVYPKKVLESQVKAIQDKINERSLVGALDHPANDAIHLSQASHLITKLWVEKNGDVMGECEILSTPNGKIVESLLNDDVKVGISSRGVGSVSEAANGKIVNEDFKLITFDLVSDPSTKGAFPELTEAIRENSQRAQDIVSKHKKQRALLTMLESKIDEAIVEARDPADQDIRYADMHHGVEPDSKPRYRKKPARKKKKKSSKLPGQVTHIKGSESSQEAAKNRAKKDSFKVDEGSRRKRKNSNFRSIGGQAGHENARAADPKKKAPENYLIGPDGKPYRNPAIDKWKAENYTGKDETHIKARAAVAAAKKKKQKKAQQDSQQENRKEDYRGTHPKENPVSMTYVGNSILQGLKEACKKKYRKTPKKGKN